MTPPTTTPTEIKMPSLGADMESGTLLEWRVAVGDKVARGDIVGLVETQKATMELESFVDGIVEALLVEPGTKVGVGTALARLRAAGDVAATAAPAPAAAPSVTPMPTSAVPPAAMPISPPAMPVPTTTPTAGLPTAPMPVPTTTPTAGLPTAPMRVPTTTPTAGLPTAAMATSIPTDERVRSSPAARKRARELDIDLERVHGSGPHGAIVLRDVIAAPPAPLPPPAPTVLVTTAFPTPVAIPPPPAAPPTPAAAAPAPAGAPGISLTPAKPSPVRDAIAAAMSKSKREIPHYYLAHTISMKRALAWLAETNAKRSIQERVLPAAVLLRAVVEALWEVPELNGFWIDNAFHASESIHLGNAIALRTGGLIAPAIIDADDKTVEEIMRDLHDLVSRARAGRLRASELTFATITVTSLGERGCEAVFPVINPPQVAIIGFGAIVQRPWVEDGGVVAAHPTIVATLAADHRVSDGHRGGLFLAALDRALQEPDKW